MRKDSRVFNQVGERRRKETGWHTGERCETGYSVRWREGRVMSGVLWSKWTWVCDVRGNKDYE